MFVRGKRSPPTPPRMRHSARGAVQLNPVVRRSRELRQYPTDAYQTAGDVHDRCVWLSESPGAGGKWHSSVLLVGDSFSTGSGVSDELTLAGQLAQRGAYRRTPWRRFSRAPIRSRRSRGCRKMKPGSWVVHQQTYLYSEADAQILEPTSHPRCRRSSGSGGRSRPTSVRSGSR